MSDSNKSYWSFEEEHCLPYTTTVTNTISTTTTATLTITTTATTDIDHVSGTTDASSVHFPLVSMTVPISTSDVIYPIHRLESQFFERTIERRGLQHSEGLYIESTPICQEFKNILYFPQSQRQVPSYTMEVSTVTFAGSSQKSTPYISKIGEHEKTQGCITPSSSSYGEPSIYHFTTSQIEEESRLTPSYTSVNTASVNYARKHSRRSFDIEREKFPYQSGLLEHPSICPKKSRRVSCIARSFRSWVFILAVCICIMEYLAPLSSSLFVIRNAEHVCINMENIQRLVGMEGVNLLNPEVYQTVTEEQLRHIFRSHTAEPIPLFDERLNALRCAGKTLLENFDGSFKNALSSCENSAAKLLKLLCDYFPSFRDYSIYKGKHVSFLKRAQILIGDLWYCFEGKGFGYFHDIDEITAFADYRVPQVLCYFGAIEYSEDLTKRIRNGEEIANGSELEVEIRAATILAVHNIAKSLNSKNISCNSIVVDNFLWNYRRSHADEIDAKIPMHRTRCIYY
ncbi:unnamed protein product [Schistosoma mattheei]|uniref:Queuosine 5'-phosphate N-glycosylase/hydrolase n=1 Tax=Schistosoma mattheei TaxID=31246 RepID=A0AA85BX52_9TREM|nr:unnamed protein product [Schistosoma mattheei]